MVLGHTHLMLCVCVCVCVSHLYTPPRLVLRSVYEGFVVLSTAGTLLSQLSWSSTVSIMGGGAEGATGGRGREGGGGREGGRGREGGKGRKMRATVTCHDNLLTHQTRPERLNKICKTNLHYVHKMVRHMHCANY